MYFELCVYLITFTNCKTKKTKNNKKKITMMCNRGIWVVQEFFSHLFFNKNEDRCVDGARRCLINN